MFERYTEQARRAMFFARSEMSEVGGSSIDTAHLLAGILADAKGGVRAIVGTRNITYADVRDQLRTRIDGCSDLFVEVFGDRGRHARSAIGVASLPDQIPVEIEAVVEVRP